MKILILGYSKIVRRRILKVLQSNKNKIFVATKSFKDPIPGIKKKYNSYDKALKECKPNLVYISLPNSMHYYWAKKALNYKCHTIVDKPITMNLSELNNLIEISNKSKKILSEATFFNYHSQFIKIRKIFKKTSYKFIDAKFVIPKPSKNSILLSKKLGGGVLMDMGPYISSLPRIFNLKNIIDKKVLIKKNNKNLIVSINFILNFKEGKYIGKFKFNSNYLNTLRIKNKNTSAQIFRVFSPPSDEILRLNLKRKNKLKIFKFRQENCFKNYFEEIKKKIKDKYFKFYHARMIDDCAFRLKLI